MLAVAQITDTSLAAGENGSVENGIDRESGSSGEDDGEDGEDGEEEGPSDTNGEPTEEMEVDLRLPSRRHGKKSAKPRAIAEAAAAEMEAGPAGDASEDDPEASRAIKRKRDAPEDDERPIDMSVDCVCFPSKVVFSSPFFSSLLWRASILSPC